MTRKSKLAALATVLLAAAVAWLIWPRDSAPPSPPAGDRSDEEVLALQADLPEPGNPDMTPDQPPQRELVAAQAAAEPGTGALIVHARYGDDQTPASGNLLFVARPGSDPRIEAWRERTDEAGTARWPSLPSGRHYVANDSRSQRVDITAGQTTEIDFELELGLTLTGIVVDAEDVPIPGALVETTMMARADSYPEVVATTGPDGRFTARACPIYVMVGARAPGYTASPLRILLGKDGNTADIELVLGVGGGSVEGLVVDAGGQPVADAVVIIGEGQLSGIGGRDHAPPFPALSRSDEEGRFTAAGETVTCELQLSLGLQLAGRVVDEGGQPVERAIVEFHSESGESWFAVAWTDVQGRFMADNCPEEGTIMVTARGAGIEELRRTGVDPRAGEMVLRVRRAARRSVRIAGTVVAPDALTSQLEDR